MPPVGFEPTISAGEQPKTYALDRAATGTSTFITYLTKEKEYNEAVHQLFTAFKKAYDSLKKEILHNILIKFGILMKPVRIINMCLNETYSRIWVDKHTSDMFPTENGLKQGDALLPLLFNFVVQCAIRTIPVNQNGLKLNGTFQVLVYADDVNTLGGSVHSIKKNAEALEIASKENGLEVNADKTKYKVMSRDQAAGQVTIQRLTKVPLKGWNSSIFGNNTNELQFYSGRNYEQTEARECLRQIFCLLLFYLKI